MNRQQNVLAYWNGRLQSSLRRTGSLGPVAATVLRFAVVLASHAPVQQGATEVA